MAGFIRRVVTGHDKHGKAIVIADGTAPVVKTNPLRPGRNSIELAGWRPARQAAVRVFDYTRRTRVQEGKSWSAN